MIGAVWTQAAAGGIDVSVAEQAQVVGLVAVAAVLGAALGGERELANKSAGIRTHMLLAAGSALAVGVGDFVFEATGEAGDPARALHAVLTGIGFLGAGAIIRRRDRAVEGLTTAASLWFAAAVGIAAGLGLVVLAAGGTAIGLAVLRFVAWAERKVAERTGRTEFLDRSRPAERVDGSAVDDLED